MFKKIVTLTLAAALSLGAFVDFGSNAQAAKTFVIKEITDWTFPNEDEFSEEAVEFIPTFGKELFSITVSNDTPVVGTVITVKKPQKPENATDLILNIYGDDEKATFSESDGSIDKNADSVSYTLKKNHEQLFISWYSPLPNPENSLYPKGENYGNGFEYWWLKNGEFRVGGASSYCIIEPADASAPAAPAPAAPVVTPAPAAPAAPATSTVPAIGQTYTVKKGDSLFKIAKKAYNDGNLYIHIYNANKNIIKKPSLIKPGQVLTIPTI